MLGDSNAERVRTGETMIRKLLLGVAISGALTLGLSGVTSAQEPGDAKQDAKKAREEAKAAGKETGQAAKDAAKATGKTVKSAAKKTGQVTKDAAKETATGTKKAAKNVKKERQAKPKPVPTEGNRKAFDQLLDDAIFGVKRKVPRG